MTSLRFEVSDPASSTASKLLMQFRTEVNERYPDELIKDIDIQDFIAVGGVFVIVYVDDVARGCAAFYPLCKRSVEVKRMYVCPDYRGRGMSRLLLAHLEDIARKQGFEWMKLETGRRQPEAIGLYLSEAYQEIDPFGSYVNDPNSICFEKPL
ncbi:GNAT family N-acetyltransferase [Echinimonas agarilytica]|uniref:GNAT family N-acetyltransferase n=1 Tax=Echinimonas agarilytica TaxID=1215918 RepID=A0AA41W6A7_9GAMM|nr:GNAT family N-acetyltransferase [Echinimonas agarilytica]MCM2679443.1 GNAT family N-acetyltransferase [Echinimonas agarilytica]